MKYTYIYVTYGKLGGVLILVGVLIEVALHVR